MKTAGELWTELGGTKNALLRRAERYAELTLPKLLTAPGHNKEGDDLTHDYQSLGAQAVNHLANRIMMVMFRPSAPFFRMQFGKRTKKAVDPKQLKALEPELAKIEREAVRTLDSRAQRPKLYSVIRHLIVTGNVLMIQRPGILRVMSLKYYSVKRTVDGRLHTLVTHENVAFNELETDVQAAVPATMRKRDDNKVDYYNVVRLQPDGRYKTEQWVENVKLDDASFGGTYTADTLPFRVLVWDLSDEHDYGTGLVEEYVGDFEALSTLAEAVVDGSVVGTELRWLIDPTANFKAEDFNKSRNGDALPGRKEDLTAVYMSTAQSVQQAQNAMQDWERRLARAFLLLSAVTRDAERVTAEEIRMLTQELESAHGGVHSSLSAQIQAPIARWLLADIDMDIGGADIELEVITGLDALSRSWDLEAFRRAMNDLALIEQLPPDLKDRMDWNVVARFVGDGHGISLTDMFVTDEVYAERVAQRNAAMVEQNTALAVGEAAAQGINV